MRFNSIVEVKLEQKTFHPEKKKKKEKKQEEET